MCVFQTYNSLIDNIFRAGGDNVSEKERKIGKKLAATFEALPDRGKEFLLGFMEGVAAAKDREKIEHDPKDEVNQAS